MSDIHGNLEALNAVLEDSMKYYDISKVFILGDIVDYGADSVEVIHRLLELKKTTRLSVIYGNHDKAVLDDDYFTFRTSHGILSAEITRKEIVNDPEAYNFLKFYPTSCKETHTLSGDRFIRCVHGTVMRVYWGDPGKLIPFNSDEAVRIDIHSNLVLCGHSHIRGYTFSENPLGRVIINPGSVGQPRNGNPRAQYILAEDDFECLYIKDVEYDIDTAAKKIVESGRPSFLATRLYLGI